MTTDSGTTLTGLFAGSVRRFGDRVAVSDEARTLTYADLDRESDQLAALLLHHGIAPEDRVGIYLERSAGLFAAILGVLKAGAAYVAVDPRYPDARRDLMLRAGEAKVVVTEPGWAGRLAGLGVDVVVAPAGGLPGGRSGDPEATPGSNGAVGSIAPDTAASVLFTSGSAGEPKAIVLEHRNIASFARNITLPQLTPEDRTGQISSVSFDAFHFEMWATLSHGARAVVLPRVQELLDGDFQRQMKRYGITAMLVPTMVVNHVVHEDRDAFSSLRVLQAGGDVLLPAVCRDLLAGSFGGELVNLYGPAEITTACTAHRVSRADAEGDTIPIGVALEGVSLHVLGAGLDPVPEGEVGELFVGGPGVARGYQNQPELTAERFLLIDGERVYRTGDLVRRRPDEVLEFIGRADDQVKIRGYRVEPGEVERALRRRPLVREVVVLPAGEGNDRQLVAFVVLDEGITVAELREHARAQLPDYMVPSRFLVLPRIPATDHGKRDTAAFADLLEKERLRVARYAPAATESERYLVGLWSELIGVDTIGRDEDFFELGGHSLLAFRMHRRLNSDLGLKLKFPVVLQNPVLGDLAAAIDDARHE